MIKRQRIALRTPPKLPMSSRNLKIPISLRMERWVKGYMYDFKTTWRVFSKQRFEHGWIQLGTPHTPPFLISFHVTFAWLQNKH